MTADLSFKQRAILKAWPRWVDEYRSQGYRVCTNAKREKLGLPWDPDAAYMYKDLGAKRTGETAEAHRRVVYYKFTMDKAPEKSGLEVWK